MREKSEVSDNSYRKRKNNEEWTRVEKDGLLIVVKEKKIEGIIEFKC